jgi:isopenicillin N synthase-like dioxygenase
VEAAFAKAKDFFNQDVQQKAQYARSGGSNNGWVGTGIERCVKIVRFNLIIIIIMNEPFPHAG